MNQRNTRKNRKSQSQPFRRQNRIYEQLEDRLLFDAVADASIEMLEGHDDLFPPFVEMHGESFDLNAASTAEHAPKVEAKEIVFVDKGVDGYELLVADLVIGRNTDVVFLDATEDGLQQIAASLDGRSEIDAIHIISHGAAAELHIGQTLLDAESIETQYANDLAVIGSALSESADILLYGCNFGEGVAGQAAATVLSAATGADVAASVDRTGTASQGGNWQLELATGAIETQVLQATAWQGLLAPVLRLDMGNINPVENDTTGAGDGSLGLQATWVNAGYVGAQRIDLRATIVSQDTTLTHDLFTRNFGGSYIPSIASVGQDWVEIQWEIFETGTTNLVNADVVVGLNDLDGPNNEAVRFNVCDPVVEHIRLASNTQMAHSFDSGTGLVTLAGEAAYGGVDERISVQVSYINQTGFTISRTANNGFFLSFDFNETLAYTDPLEFDCSNFETPVSVDDSVIGSGGAPVDIAILNNDSSSNSGAADTVELVIPVGATSIITDGDGDQVGFTVAGEGSWLFTESTGLLRFTPEANFTSDPTPVQYTFQNIDGVTSNVSTVSLDLRYAPFATDDSVVAAIGVDVEVDVLANDTDIDGTIDATSVILYDPGTGNPAVGNTVTIIGEGVYTVNPTSGAITFAQEVGFYGASAVQYSVDDNEGRTSNRANLTVTVREAPALDLNGASGGVDYSGSFSEGGTAASIVDGSTTLTDSDSTMMQSLTITSSGVQDGALEDLTFFGDGGSNVRFALTGTASATQQLTVNGTTLDIAYDGTAFTVTRNGGGAMANADVVAFLTAARFRNDSVLPTVGDRTFTMRVNDGDLDSNQPIGTISVSRQASSVEWSVTGPATVDEGATASYSISLNNSLLQSGETASVVVGISNGSTSSTDYASLQTALNTAVASRPDLSFDSGTGRLTFTSNGSAMSSLTVQLAATDDALIEGSESFSVTLSNPASSTGETVAVSSSNGSATTTINDTQGIGGAADGPGAWNLSGTASIEESESASFTVSLSGTYGAGEQVSVDIALTNVSTNSSDYASFDSAVAAAAAAHANVSYSAGTLTYTSPSDGVVMSDLIISLAAVEDGSPEGSESFTVALSAASATAGVTPTISNSSVTTTITDPVPPVLDLDGDDSTATSGNYTVDFREGTSPVALSDADATLTDANDSDMQSLRIRPGGIVDSGNERITFNGDGGSTINFGLNGVAAADQQITINSVLLNVSYDGTDLIVTRDGGDRISNADVLQILRATTYHNTLTNPIPGNRTFTITTNDGANDSNQTVTTIDVIPDYLTVAATSVTLNEDATAGLGVTVDPDLYFGGPLQDIVGTATGFRSSSAGSTATSFTIPSNVTGIVITGYSTEPDDTPANDTYNDDYQVLSAYIDVAKGISNGTLTRHIDLSGGGTRDADQFSWEGAELGTGVLDGSGVLSGETAGGTNPVFSIVGNQLRVVENHGLESAYHVEFMTSNRESTNFVGTLSAAQLPGSTTSTFTIPSGTNYLLLNENAAAPGSNFRYEYKGFSRIYIDLDTMTASGTIAAEIGENSDRTVTYAFENYDISASTPGGILASGATIVGDTTSLAAVSNSPNIYINGSGELVVERASAYATDFTSMYTLEAYERTGYSSIAAIVDASSDDALFNATAGGGVINTLSFDVPASAKVGVFRLSMGTPGGNGDNENMGTGFAIVDLDNGISSGSFMNIRTTTPDLLSWSNVALTDNVGTAGVDERVFFTDPNTVSNRANLSEFTDGWGGTAYFNLVTNPDGTRNITFNAVSDVGDNAYQDYQTHGQFTWLGNEPFRIRTNGSGGTFSHGSPVLDINGNPTGDWEIDVVDLPSVVYTPDSHYSGTGFLEVELLSTGEYERIDISVLPVADTPNLTLADATPVAEGATSDLSGSVAAALVDTDGSESISLIELTIADGFTVLDGTNNFTATSGSNTVDITSWNLGTLQMQSPQDYFGTQTVSVRSQTTDNKTINSTSYSDTTLPGDPATGEREATGTFQATWTAVNDPAVLDLDSNNNTATGSAYAGSFVEGGTAVAIVDSDATLSDVDDTTFASVTLTPGGSDFPDGAAEVLIFSGDGGSSISFGINGAPAATQQLTVNGNVLNVAYDGSAFTITDNGGGEILNADALAILKSAEYRNTDPTPTTGNRTFSIVVNDGDADSNTALSTISVSTASTAAEWSLSGPANVDEGGTAAFSLSLNSALLQTGETASVVLTLDDLSTSSADHADLITAVNMAIAARSDLAFDSGSRTLTWTSDGNPMTALPISLSIVNDSLIEGTESFRLSLSGAGSTTDEVITVDSSAAAVTTVIEDTQGIGGDADGPARWSVSGAASVNEGDAASYTISLSGTYGDGETATVTLGLTDNTTSSADRADLLAAIDAAIAARPELTRSGNVLTFTSQSDGDSMADLSISLTAIQDSLVEANEHFDLSLSTPGSATGVSVSLGTSSINTVINDDADTATVSVSAANSGSEAGSVSGAFDVVLSQVATTDTVINYSVGGTANGSDHGLASGSVTIAAGETSATLNVPVTDDALVEGTESVTVTLTSIAAGDPQVSIGSSSTASLDIADNEAAAQWSLTGPSSDDEGATLTYNLALSGTFDAGDTATVQIDLTDVSTTGADYSSFVSALTAAAAANSQVTFDGIRTLTFTSAAAGNSMTDLSLQLLLIDDSLIEGTERFRIDLSNAGSTSAAPVSLSSDAFVSTMIFDTQGPGGSTDGPARWSVVADSSVDEGGAADVTFRVDGILQAGEIASVDVALSNVDTTSADYANWLSAVQTAVAARPDLSFDSSTGRLTWTGTGSSMADLTVQLPIVDDSIVEGVEQFSIELTNAQSSSGAATDISSVGQSASITINDTQGIGGAPDSADWSVTGASTIDEGGTGSFTIGLDAVLQAGEVSSIEVSLLDIEASAADRSDILAAIESAVLVRSDLAFDRTSGVLTFTSVGSLMTDLNVSVQAIDDTVAEGPERYQLLLSNPGSTTGAVIGIDASNDNLTTTIQDTVGDGGPVERVVWSFGFDQTVPEGDTSVYVLTLTGRMAAAESASVQFNLSDIDTTSGDYADLNTAITGAVNTYNAGSEPGSLAWDGTTITFTSDGTGPMADLLVQLATVNDVLVEGVEDIRLAIQNPGSATGVYVSVDASRDDGVTTIDDTNGAGADQAIWNLSGADLVDEGALLRYTVNLTGTLASAETASVVLTPGDITTSAADYADFASAVQSAVASRPDLSFDSGSGRLTYTGDGSPMADLQINLAINDDSLVEGPEQFDLTLSNAASTTGALVGIGALTNNVTTTINDTVGPGGPTEPGGEWSITGTSTIAEGDTATFSIGLTGNLQNAESASVELHFTTLETDGLDHDDLLTAVQDAVALYSGPGSLTLDAVSGRLTFVSDGTGPMSGLAVAVRTTSDVLVEGPERFRVDLCHPRSTTGITATIAAASNSLTTSVRDDESAVWAISGTGSVDEGGRAPLVFSLTGVPQTGEQISVGVSVSDFGTTAADYGSFADAMQAAVAARSDLSFNSTTSTLTFTGTGSAMSDLTVELPIVDDSLTEGPEQLQVGLSLPSSATGASVLLDSASDHAIVTVNDTIGDGGAAESANWSVAAPSVIDEGGILNYDIRLSGTLQNGETAYVQTGFVDVSTSAADRADFHAAVQSAVAAYTGPGTFAYDAASATLSFLSDGRPAEALTIGVSITDDSLLEGVESVRLGLSGAFSSTGSSIAIASGAGVVTTSINDTQGSGGPVEGPAEWSLTGDTSVDEGGSVSYTISLSELLQTGENTTVTIALNDVTTDAADRADLMAAVDAAVQSRSDLTFDSSSGQLTFVSDGTAMADLNFDLSINDDSLVEGVESFAVQLSAPTSTTGIAVGLAASGASVSTEVQDTQGVGGRSDSADWSLTGDVSVDEGGVASFSIGLDSLLQSGEQASVDLRLTNIETNTSDYGDFLAAVSNAVSLRSDLTFNSSTGRLTFSSTGTTMANLTVGLPITDDAFAEGAERFLIGLADSQSTTGAAIGIDPAATSVSTTIVDTVGNGGALEQPTWHLTGPASVNEGGTARYTLQLSDVLQAAETATVRLTLLDLQTDAADHTSFVTAVQTAIGGRADLSFDGATGILTFVSDGTAMADLAIDLDVVNDVFVEGPEDFRISLSDTGSSTGVAVVLGAAADDVLTTVLDTGAGGGSDDATWSVSGSSNVDEGASATITLSLAGIPAIGETAYVQLALIDQETNSADYGSLLDAVDTAVAARSDLTFDRFTGRLTFTGTGSTMADLNVVLGVTDDSIVEGAERFSIELSNPGSTTSAAVGVDATANQLDTTINDTIGVGGITESVRWDISGTTTVDEGALGSLTIGLDGVLQAGENASVVVAVQDLTTVPSDHGSITTAIANAVAIRSDLQFDNGTGRLTFTGTGTTMSDLTVSFAAVDDTLIEGPEQFNIALLDVASTTGAAVGVSTTADDLTTTINDTVGDGGVFESGSWSLSSSNLSVDEGGTAELRLQLSGTLQSSETAYVRLSLADVGTTPADRAELAAAVQTAVAGRSDLSFDSGSGILTFISDGTAMTPLTVTIPITDDSLTEGPEQFDVLLDQPGSTSGALIVADSASDRLRFIINDTVGDGGAAESVAWNLSGSSSVKEGSLAAYRLNLTGTLQSGETASVRLELDDVSSDVADRSALNAAIQTALVGRSDLVYDAATGLLTATGTGQPIPELTFYVVAATDGVPESAEQFRVVASQPSSSTGASVTVNASAVTTTIEDVTVTTAGNLAPIASDDLVSVQQNGTFDSNLLNNDVDPNGDTIAVNPVPVIAPTNGTLTIQSDGTFRYTPNAGFKGSDSFTYQLLDADGLTDTATVQITVVADHNGSANDRPIAAADVLATAKNVPVTGTVLSNDHDPNGDPVQVVAGNGNAISAGSSAVFTTSLGGRVTLNSDGTFSYVPLDDVVGADRFTYTIADADGAQAAATVYLNVFDASPVARDDINVTTSGVPVTGNVLQNDDSGPDRNDNLTVQSTPVRGPDHGSLLLQSDGSYTYTPNATFEGTDSFEYEVRDEAGHSATAVVTVEVRNPGNPASPGDTAPIASNDQLTVLADGSLTTYLLASDGDPNGEVVTVTEVGAISVPPGGSVSVSTPHGTVTVSADGIATYTPTPGFIGTESFVYTLTDAGSRTDTATVSIEVVPDRNGSANNEPTAGADVGITTMNVPITGNLLTNDHDLNGDLLSLVTTPLAGPSNGTLTLAVDGSYTYRPNHDFTGNDSFVYQVTDGNGGTDTATVHLNISAQPPVATADRFVTTVGVPISGNVLSNDLDVDAGDTLRVNTVPVSAPANGSLALNSDGSFHYTPRNAFTGVDLFTYEVCDDAGLCDTATVELAIADISAATEVLSVVENGENFDTTIRVTVQNTGGTTLNDVSARDDIAARFGSSFLSISGVTLDSSGISGGVIPTLNSSWSTDTTQPMLDSSAPSTLDPGESFSLTFTVTSDPDAGGTSTPVSLQAAVSGVDRSTTVSVTASDLSDSGRSPTSINPTAPGDTGTRNDATPVLIADAGLTSEVVDIEREGVKLILTIDLNLENTGTADLTDLTILNDLRQQFGENFDAVLGDPVITSSSATTNPVVRSDWAGDVANIFDGSTGLLKPGESITMQIRVRTQPGSTTVNELKHQASGGGQGTNPDGSPMTDGSGNPIAQTLDQSDSGNDPNGSNPDAPGDTGGTDDATTTTVDYYVYDSFNEFSRGHGELGESQSATSVGRVVPMVERQILTKQINTLAPEPIFSGSARPGTRIVGRIYDSAGHVMGETMSFADTGGNWMMRFHGVDGLDFHRIEFVEVVGQGDPFGAYGDIYGYLGSDMHANDYAAMEPVTAFAERFTLGTVSRRSTQQSLKAAEQANTNPLGFGV